MTGSVMLTPAVLRQHPIPGPEEQGDKEARGRVLVVAGSPEVPGAALLAATAALAPGLHALALAGTATVTTVTLVALDRRGKTAAH